MRTSLETFLKYHQDGDAVVLKATEYLRSVHPNILIPESAIKNAISKLRVDPDDVDKTLKILTQEKKEGHVEFVQTLVDEDSGVLSSLIWAFKGTKVVVARCGDLGFWDFTHNSTRYPYKLSSLPLVDSEGRTRPILFHLTLYESTNDQKRIVDAWHKAFKVPFVKAVFTDGDETMSSAIFSQCPPQSTCVYYVLSTFFT